MNESRTKADAERLFDEGLLCIKEGRFAETEEQFSEATEILKNLGQTYDPLYAHCLCGWAESLRNSGAYSPAVERYEQAVAAFEAQQLPHDFRYAYCMFGLADSLRASGAYALAMARFEKAAATCEAQKLTHDSLYAHCLCGWAESLRMSGAYDRAVERYQQTAAACETQNLTDDRLYVGCLYGWAESLRRSGYYARAVEQFEQAVAACEAQQFTHDRLYAYCLYGWADSLRMSDAYVLAVERYKTLAATCEAQLLTHDRLYAESLIFWADSLRLSGSYDRAVERYEEAAAACEAQQLNRDRLYAQCLWGWADSLRRAGAYVLAVERYEKAAATFEAQLLTHDRLYAECLSFWADSLRLSGSYTRAVVRYEQTAAACEAQQLTYDHLYVGCLYGWAESLRNSGAYARAVERYETLAATCEAQLLTHDRLYAQCLLSWAESLRRLGAYAQAVGRFKAAASALVAQELTLDRYYAVCLLKWAESLLWLGDHARAVVRFEAAAAAFQAQKLMDDLDYAGCLFGWAISLLLVGQVVQALGRFAAAAVACLETHSDVAPVHAQILRHMAACCMILGSPEHAWDALLEALMREDFLMVDAFRGMTPKQRYEWLQTASCDALLTLVLEAAAAPAAVPLAATGTMASANQGIQALTQAYQIMSGRVPLGAERAGLALDQLLRRKGMMTESLARQRERARQQLPQPLRPLMEQLIALWRQLLRKRFADPGRAASAEVRDQYTSELAALQGRAKYLEDKLRPTGALASEDLEELLVKVGRSAVAEALPAGACLVEFVQYSTSEFLINPVGDKGRTSPGNYAVFVLHAGRPEEVFLKRLGLASEINPLVLDWQRQLEESEEQFYLRLKRDPEAKFRSHCQEQKRQESGQEPSETEVTQAVVEKFLPKFRKGFAEANAIRLKEREAVRQRVSAMIWGPVAGALGQATQVFIAPDGELNKLPFELLPGSMGGYLGDELAISYLSSGRDLIRWGRPIAGPAGPSAVVVAPDFDLGGALDAPMPRLTIGAQEVTAWDDFDPRTLETLPGALAGGKRTAIRLGVPVTVGGECLKEKVLELSSPRVLSLGTHGFVLRHVPLPMPVEAEGGFKSLPMRLSAFPNPLFRCGMAMAGFRTFLKGRPTPPGAGIGLILGVEITEMDLSGTELVAVEVCRAGDGEAWPGDGVMGLRHAFILAGARCLVMPRWSVNDVATAVLMDRFWHNLEAGMSRLDALREAREYLRESPAVELRARYRSQVEEAPLQEDFKERFENDDNWRPFEDPCYWGGFFLHGSPGPMLERKPSGAE